jgi:hypothetical protein
MWTFTISLWFLCSFIHIVVLLVCICKIAAFLQEVIAAIYLFLLIFENFNDEFYSKSAYEKLT